MVTLISTMVEKCLYTLIFLKTSYGVKGFSIGFVLHLSFETPLKEKLGF